MRFQKRDGDILLTIYENDGVMARRQLQTLFWPEATRRAMEKRLAKLHKEDFINWPTPSQWRSRPVPESVCWLGWRGAQFIASQYGVKVGNPTRENENQLRSLQQRLREQGIRWVREPRWDQLSHDLAVIDFKLAMITSAAELPNFVLDLWIPESEFRANPDVVEYKLIDREGNIHKRKKGVIPDAYFVLVDENRRLKNQPCKAQFLLEVDMATHALPRFAENKIAAGAAYLSSPEYQKRFGHNAGWWLIVTSGEIRMNNLILKAQKALGETDAVYLFTTLGAIEVADVLKATIWFTTDSDVPNSLVTLMNAAG